MQPVGSVAIALEVCQHGNVRHRSGPSCCRCGASVQHRLQTLTPFGEVLSALPESEQRQSKAKRPVDVPGSVQPVERRAEVVVFDIAARQPDLAGGSTQPRIAFFRQDDALR